MTSLPLKILVLDASPRQMLAAEGGLSDESVQVLGARDLAAAIELARQHEVALALLDLDLPGGDAGVRQLCNSERLRGVPIVVLGSTPAQASAWDSGDAGAVDFLLKPLPAQRLRRSLRRWLDLAVQKAELDEQQQELQRLARLQAAMIGALSHDIRTPLSALTLNAELVARGSEAHSLRQAAQRIRSALAMLGLQIDHLVNVAGPGNTGLRPIARPLDLCALVQDRLRAFSERSPTTPEWALSGEGDAEASVDATLIADALDALLKLAAAHAGAGAVTVVVDGQSRRSVTLRIQFAAALPDAGQRQLFAGAPPQPGAPAPRVGPALAEAESIVRAHGGSLIGRSRLREGTLFECLLPRGLD